MKGDKTELLAIRLDEATAERLRSFRAHLSEPFRDATLSDVVRRVLSLGLRIIDDEGTDILHDVPARREPAEVANNNEEEDT
jgi:hypothetical protein